MGLRADRQYPDVYFGRPGALVKLPYPRGDMDKTYDRSTFDFVTGAGQHMVSSLVGGSRLYSVTWNALHLDNYKLISQYWLGNMGVGPWAFIDPSMPNMLQGNQSSATAKWMDAREWTTSATNNGTPSSNSNSTFIHRTGSPRSLRWLFSVAAATTPELALSYPYRSWFGFPVVAGLPYAFSAWLRPDGTVDTSITAGLKMRWVDAAGVQISDLDGGQTAITAWTQKTCLGTAPAGAAYVQPRVVATGSSITTGGSLYVDEPMLEQDTVVNDWASGTGLRPVEILSLTDTVPFASRFRTGITLTFRELAA